MILVPLRPAGREHNLRQGAAQTGDLNAGFEETCRYEYGPVPL